MSDFYKQDIFFFVTTIAVIVFTLVLVIGIIYVIRILNDIKYISNKAKQESDLLVEDLRELRKNVTREGFKLKSLFNFFSGLLKKRKK